MIHVLLRVLVWVLVLGIGYLVFGPDVFDSSRQDSPFEGAATLYLPPEKSPRERDYEATMAQRSLDADEAADYGALVKERQSRFWQQEGVSVEEALSGVSRQRRERLAEILQQRGVTQQEAAVFFLVLDRDHPGLLDDRD